MTSTTYTRDRNRPPTERELVSVLDELLSERLPSQWRVDVAREPLLPSGARPDAVVRVVGPDGSEAHLVVEAKRRLDGSQVAEAANQIALYLRTLRDEGRQACGVVMAPWMSEVTRRRLQELGLGYLDATGNVRIVCDRPALFIEGEGARRSPWPDSKRKQSLKGPAAGRAVRALVDFVPPYGIRELATAADVSPSTLSRVVSLLEREGLLERSPRGPVETVDWEGTLRRWAEDYEVADPRRTATFLDPRGGDTTVNTLRATPSRYAVTGTLAVPEEAVVSPPRLAMVYTDDFATLASTLGLRATDTGANVLLLEPFDDVVYDRMTSRRGVNAVAPSQLAADLLTGPGRSPTEGEELLEWMGANEDQWRQAVRDEP